MRPHLRLAAWLIVAMVGAAAPLSSQAGSATGPAPGVDAPNHLLELDEAGIRILLQKRLPFVVTLDDLVTR